MFKEALDVAANHISARLDEIFAGLDDKPVTRAMAYGSDGGKRLRGFLVGWLPKALVLIVVIVAVIWLSKRTHVLRAFDKCEDTKNWRETFQYAAIFASTRINYSWDFVYQI